MGIPIDIVGLFLAGIDTKEYSILIVDEFQRFNHVKEDDIKLGLQKIKRSLNVLSKIYDFRPNIIVSSDFMRTSEYKQTSESIERRISELGLNDDLLKTVPPKYRTYENPCLYPLNEIACVDFLIKNQGIGVKIGPSKEHSYDSIMRKIGLNVNFAYVIDAYALGTENNHAESVIHYIPEHRGTGQRLLLPDSMFRKEEDKIMLGPDEAARYFLTLASVSGHRLNKTYLSPEEIKQLFGKKLRKVSRNLVLENIIKPYQEAAENV